MLLSYVQSRHILLSLKGLESRSLFRCAQSMTLTSRLMMSNQKERKLVVDSLLKSRHSILSRGFTDCRKFQSEKVGVNQLNDSSDDSKSYLLEGATQDEDTDKRNKTYYRAKQLCSILKKKGEKIFKEFTLKYKKHYYTLQDGTYYQFPTTKEVIIDADVILKSKNRIYKNLLTNSMKSVKRELANYRGIEKTSIIVILGHFNHGKTTLLDALGKFTIVEKEVHGITQEIRTCYLPISADDKETFVTIIDTPGQEIFYRMRNYGVSVADMVLLVVSLEDGVCNQTEESIGAVETIINDFQNGENNENTSNSGKNIPIIVCMNKMDSKALGDDVEERIQSLQKELMEYNILENAIFVPISAKIGTNLNILKEKIIEIVFKQKDLENNRYIEEDERLKLEQEEKINKLKEQRNNDNLNITENKIKILNANGKIINKSNGNDKKSIKVTEKEKEKEKEKDVFDEMYQFRKNSSSAGVLLDIEKSRKLGTTLHVVIRRGEVQEGDYYAAGGWNGQVKRISHENGDNTLTNRTFEDGRTSVGRCGWGVKIIVSVDSLSDEPNPLGDEILFFSSDGSKSYQKSLELNKKKNNILNNFKYDHINDYSNENKTNENENEKDNTINHEKVGVLNSELREDTESQTRQRQRYFAMYSTEAALLALECADSARMKHSIDMYAMTDEAADRMNIPKLWDLMKKRGNKKKHDFDPAKERERIKQKYKLSIYDENGVRVVMEDDNVNSDNENDDYDKEEMERDYAEGNNENEEEDDEDDDDEEEEEEEEEEDEISDAIKERNQRIKDKNREEEELDVQKQQNKKLGRNVMIRTLSDVYLSTITDCLDFENDVVQEEKDDYQNYNEKGKKYTEPEPLPLPLSIISSSIGEITTKDIMIASAANATIMMYLLPLNSDSQKLAKERGVRMVAFDKFEDVIKIIREGLYKELLDMAKFNHKPEKKKKKNK